MKQFLYILAALLLSMPIMAVERTNAYFIAKGVYVEESTVGGLGLEGIFIFKSLQGSTVVYSTPNTEIVNFYTYQNSLADKTPISVGLPSKEGNRTLYTISNLQDSRGAIVAVDKDQTKAVWIIDYSAHLPKINSIMPVEAADKCEVLKLLIDKNDLLEYRGTGGEVRGLERKYTVSYDILEWSKEDEDYIPKIHTTEPTDIGTEVTLYKAPNTDTQFTIRGDQYATKLGVDSEWKSNLYKAIGVEANMIAKRTERDSPTEQNEGEELGGSAPIEIKFLGFGNKSVAYFYTWYVYNTKDMNNPVARFNDEDMDYVFEQSGDYKVILEVADETSTCVDSTSVTFNVSESNLKIPNFFTPRSSPGSNDEFRVLYKSLVKFRITIVNRWGNKVYESRDPAQGWDGRYKGRMVNPGVYFYRIEATGSEGRKYNEAGDINIL